MNMQLSSLINEIRIAKGLSSLDEAAIKQTIVIRILHDLGWNIFDIKDIRPEYPVDPDTKERVDFALAQDTDNMVFVEVKTVSADLEKWEDKFCLYCFKFNVALGVLTNGISWWFYLPREKGSFHERKFFSIDLIQQETATIVSRFEDFLSKPNVVNGRAVENAAKTFQSKQKSQIIKKALPLAWNELISSEDDSLIDLFNDMLEKISGYRAESEVIAEFWAENRNKLLFWEGQTAQAARKEPGQQIEGEKTTKNTRKGYTGKAISAFVFNNNRYAVRSWKQLLLTLCSDIARMHMKDFNKVLSLKGRKRPYFTKNLNELRAPERIEGTDIFAETNLSANHIVTLSEEILSLFGYTEHLRIESE